MLSETDFNRAKTILSKALFSAGETDFSKVLWRMSHGSKTKALSIATEFKNNYTFLETISEEDFEEVFDSACADITGGLEIEWASE